MRGQKANCSVVETLEKLGARVIYGIPGIHNLSVYEALLDSSLRHITTRHEQGAGFAADGQARVSGRPGVALVISGPGLTNILTPMGQAFHDSIPLLVISTHIPSHLLDGRSGFLHELRQSNTMVRSVAKESFRIHNMSEIPDVLTRAYALSQSGRPGPVHVEIPMDLLECPWDGSGIPAKCEPFPVPVPSDEDFATAFSLLQSSRKPVLVVGGGCRAAESEVQQFAEKLGIPVLTTCAGKGVFPESHFLSLGTRLHFPAVRELLRESDLLIAVGTELSPTDLWEFPFTIGGKLIRIDLDPHHRIHPLKADVFLQGDAAGTLRTLLQELPDSLSRTSFTEEIRGIRRTCREDLGVVTGLGAELDTVTDFIDALRQGLPKETCLYADMTTPAYVALSEYPVEAPNRFIHPVGFGTLGWALPAAIGAAVEKPNAPVVVLAGDGGFQFTLPELAVAVQEKIPLPIVIWNDGGFGEIRRNEEARHPGRNIAVNHKNPDFLALALAYGAEGEKVRTPEDLISALSRALAADGPFLIEVMTGIAAGESQ